MAISINQQGVGTAAHHHGEEQGASTGTGDHSAQQHPHVSAHTSPLLISQPFSMEKQQGGVLANIFTSFYLLLNFKMKIS